MLCQGIETEHRYFKSLIALYHASGAKVQSDGLDPVKLTQKALKLAKRDDFDQVFIVVDLDDTPRAEIERAISLCKKNSTKKHQFTLIVSSTCFEVWLIAHERKPAESVSSPQGLQRHTLQLGLVG
ncbi:RloB family protein [Corynebacterium mendelii]|uniref:RloB domain-containing protein n=1 Tax=Corynebacterium mendelii TaxID=2765362 RepID=A0A939IYH5_9CORY|nr:RloB domain-containing protein [Corynebacterium mendelii]